MDEKIEITSDRLISELTRRLGTLMRENAVLTVRIQDMAAQLLAVEERKVEHNG